MNVNDYLVWRGDILFSDDYPFNDVDALILARFSYLPFDKIKLGDETISSISSKMEKLDISDFKIDDDKLLIHNLGKSSRFKSLKVSDFVFNKVKSLEKQFGAVTIHLPNFIYISYIGTDNSLVGWKEDCNMSFKKNVPAQKEGVKYLSEIAFKYKGLIALGGHSKGGNVAVYSALKGGFNNRIIRAFNFDGPGFEKVIFDECLDKSIISKIITYIPQDSVIGRLLEHEEEYKVVSSNNKGLYQHDIYSWNVLKDSLVMLPEVTNSSEFVNQSIRQWLKNTDDKQRKVFVDCIFELLYSSDIDTFRELSKVWVSKIPKFLSTYNSISKEDRETVSKMLKEFVSAVSYVFRETSKSKFEELESKLFNS